MKNGKEKPSIKRDVRDFLIIANCSFLSLVSLLSLLLENKTITLTGFSFTLINIIVSAVFYGARIQRYQRSHE